MLTANRVRTMKGEANRVGQPYCVRLKRLNSRLTNSSHSMFGPCCWVHKGLSSSDLKLPRHLSTPAHGPFCRPREYAWRAASARPIGVNFPLKNKVEGLSPSTPWMV